MKQTITKSNPATFYIVRHGETAWNAKRILQGQIDIPLNEVGEKQAKEIAEIMSSTHFDLAFSSDLLRAHRTTDVIVAERNMAVEATESLRERKFGKFEGNPTKEYFKYLELLQHVSHDERFKHKQAEDFESDEEFSSRVVTFLRETAVANPGKNILIGAHGGVIFVLLLKLGYFTYEQADNHRVRNTGYIKLRSDGVEFEVLEVPGIEKRTLKKQQTM